MGKLLCEYVSAFNKSISYPVAAANLKRFENSSRASVGGANKGGYTEEGTKRERDLAGSHRVLNWG